MKPLIVLIAAFVISLVVTFLFGGNMDYTLSGNIAMCIMLWFTAIGHFAYKKGMVMMMPGFIPFKTSLVFATGILECVLGMGLLFIHIRMIASWILILFFILILPVNIHAAIKRVDYQKGNFEGKGISYLWFRIPLQIIFIVWVWYFGVGYFL
ncbi:MAG: hypothetical protein EPN39_03745 [Chitinophagaceae bacterium]|nr:MAG: hypothetical protein EPN39_03745 [Chitinophagaceae bacterium]